MYLEVSRYFLNFRDFWQMLRNVNEFEAHTQKVGTDGSKWAVFAPQLFRFAGNCALR